MTLINTCIKLAMYESFLTNVEFNEDMTESAKEQVIDQLNIQYINVINSATDPMFADAQNMIRKVVGDSRKALNTLKYRLTEKNYGEDIPEDFSINPILASSIMSKLLSDKFAHSDTLDNFQKNPEYAKHFEEDKIAGIINDYDFSTELEDYEMLENVNLLMENIDNECDNVYTSICESQDQPAM